MLAPVSRLKKTTIIWLSRHRCKHKHTYLEHYNCYLKDNPEGQRVGFLDIETSNLDANYGIMLCYCIKELGKNKILERTITKAELKKELDKKLVGQCVKDINKFDRVITYYGTGFDIPFIRTRALRWNLDFPIYGELWHDDIYYIIRNKFKLHRNRMEVACQTLLGKTRKTHINPDLWTRALQGDQRSIKYILDHCRRDVKDLEELYNKVINFKRESETSA